MEVLQTDTWHEALELKAAHPDAVPIAGGTDLMVELNFDRAPPTGDPRPDSDPRADRVAAPRTVICASAPASPIRG